MSSEARVEITNNADLLRVVEEVSRARRRCILSRDHEPIVVVSPVRKRRSAERPTEADIAVTQSAAGG
jgi:hypothetical protein